MKIIRKYWARHGNVQNMDHRNQQNNESLSQNEIKLPVETLRNKAVDFGFKKYCAGLRKLMSTFGHNRFLRKNDHFFLTATTFFSTVWNARIGSVGIWLSGSLLLHIHVRATAVHVPQHPQRGSATGPGEPATFQVARLECAGRPTDNNSYNSWWWH